MTSVTKHLSHALNELFLVSLTYFSDTRFFLVFKQLNFYVCKMEQSQLTTDPKAESFITVQQYAVLKNVSVQAVYGKINRKTITVKKIGNFILVKDL